ncbi:MAG TPA: AmmeMemoRadiSam system protein A [Desulfobacteraceae bacterium]|nr:AmmeMemoRadiSam system protein A [Desulfobacteraceae bacterium]|tara:strand:- start:1514 stop:2143 length:630 start_codon:yes stop_codon:yes gene_type:complete
MTNQTPEEGNINPKDGSQKSDRVSKHQAKMLLAMARNSIGERLKRPTDEIEPGVGDASFLEQKQGVFVTLHKQGRLRGCIGNIEPVKSIRDGIAENAVHAAFRDTRFAPLSEDEFDHIDIEVSLLSVPVPLDFKDSGELTERLIPGRHGVILEHGGCRSTFLPQVWEQLPRPEDFLSHLCTKAGLPASAWKDRPITVYTYEVQSFGELG